MVDITYDRRLPESTSTRAYQGNSTVRVWMSLKPDQLEFNDQGVVVSDVVEEGDFVLSGHDPFNIQDSLEKIDYSFGFNGFAGFKIRLINPTPKFEATVLSWYRYLYGDTDPVRKYQELLNQEERRNSITGDAPEEILGFPQLFIRWGYGSKAEEGISSIHAARVTNIKYSLNAKRERVIELNLADPFTFLMQGTFNEEGITATVSLFDDAGRLKTPSEIISELLASIASRLPEFTSIIDLESGSQSYRSRIDSMYYQLLLSLTKTDTLSDLKNSEIPIAAPGDIQKDIFSEEELQAIEEALDTNLDPRIFLEATRDGKQARNFGAILEAYSLLFKELGFNFKQGRQLSKNELLSTQSDRTSARQDIPFNYTDKYAGQESELASNYEDFLNQKIVNLEQNTFSFYPSIVAGSGGRTRPATNSELLELENQGFSRTTTGRIYTQNYNLFVLVSRTFNFSINELNEKLEGPQGPVEGNPVVLLSKISQPLSYVKTTDSGGKTTYTPSLVERTGGELTQESKTKLQSLLAAAYGEHEDSFKQDLIEPPVVAPVKAQGNRISLTSNKEYYVTFNSDEFETFYKGLEYIIAKINSLCVFSISKLWFFPIDISNLTSREKTEILKQFIPKNKINETIERSKSLFVITDQQSLIEKFGTKLLRRIYSWPEITGYYENEIPNYELENRITLDVAAENSIVADVSFQGDIRMLASLASVPYTMDQLDDLRKLFEVEFQYEDIIHHLFYEARSYSITTLFGSKNKQYYRITDSLSEAQSQFGSEQVFSDEFLRFMPQAFEDLRRANENYLKDLKLRLADHLPEKQLNRITEEFLENLIQLISNDELYEVLFPLADISDEDRKMRNSAFFVIGENGIEKETRDYITTRKVAINSALEKSQKQALKAVDSNMQAWLALSDNAWRVDVVTLGIPELDIPVYEFTSRYVNLVVNEERVPGAVHWLTGLYKIVGLQHAISPRSGYLTKLKLIKIPNG